MRKDVLIIGGGATGAGIVRDLAMRGADCLLLEMGDYCNGASGGNHGLLHSGGRYAVKDPNSATECAEENTILRKIAPFCIEDTGGLFVSLPSDDPTFPIAFHSSCISAGVKIDRLTPREALAQEPGLDTSVQDCYSVLDGSIDPFALVQANVDDAREAGAEVINHCQVTAMEVEGGRVSEVEFKDHRNGQAGSIKADVVINAAGAWASKVAAMAGSNVSMGLDQGSMLVVDGRHCSHVINRLRAPSNGDIAVPNHTSTILGTTSRPSSSAGDVTATSDDVDLLLRETSALLPSLSQARIVRVYGGVRPLLSGGGRDASRSFSVLQDEDVENLMTVVGGKLTTYRLMAQKVTDQVCDMLGLRADCRTHKEVMGPSPTGNGRSIAEARLVRKYGKHASSIGLTNPKVICSCEQVLRSEVEHVIDGPDVVGMTDVMRRTRAGMGYCQGLDCSLGVLEAFVERRNVDPMALLEGFLLERGNAETLLIGEQLRQLLLRHHVLNGVYGLEGGR